MTSPNLAGLKPCPFCGSEDTEIRTSSIGMAWGKCLGCGCEGPVRNFIFAATEAWNTRAALRTVSDEPGAGWKLVPVKPTEAMLNAPLPEGSSITGVKFESRRDLRPLIYRTMIGAAPDPAMPDTQSREASDAA